MFLLAKKLLLALLVLDLLVWQQIFSAPGGEKLFFLDVGQGDSSLIQIGGLRLLVDAGPAGGGVVRELDKILPASDKYIDLAIISHPQADHYGGLAEVARNYRLGAFLWNGTQSEAEGWAALMEELRKRQIPLIPVLAGDVIRLGETNIRVLSPTIQLLQSAETNDGSLVLLVDGGQWKELLTGDAGFTVEKYLRNTDLRADILKVGHHGSKYASGDEFLRAVSPLLAVIEVGARNSYGHPAPATLERLAQIGAQVLRTDQNGTLELDLSGGLMRVFAEK